MAAGSRPGRRPTFFACPKKVGKERAARCVTRLRRVPCVARILRGFFDGASLHREKVEDFPVLDPAARGCSLRLLRYSVTHRALGKRNPRCGVSVAGAFYLKFDGDLRAAVVVGAVSRGGKQAKQW